MGTLKFRGRSVLGGLALAIAIALVPAAPAIAATFPNACQSTVDSNNRQFGVTITANSPATVAPNDSFQLTNIAVDVNIPPSIFVLGYNVGVLQVGPNTIPASVRTTIEGTNTVEGTQDTDTVSTSISTTISDPDGSPNTGDESATDGTLSFTHDDQTWTAGGSPGEIEFREDTVPISGFGGGIVINAVVSGILAVNFGCSPGTVTGPDPGAVTLDDPAIPFATTQIVANEPPIADAGADRTVDSEQAGVTLDGTGSSDPDGDALTYSWTQIGGPGVSLSGADTATPSFDAPVGPATLEFELSVDDGGATDTDTVVVTVEAPPAVDAAAELILNGPTRSAATKKGFVVRVTNLGTGPITIDPAADTSAVVTVNGSEAGSVELKSTNSKTLDPGARTRFRYQWNLEGSVLPGDTVVYSGTVSLADDADPGNNTDSATATAR